MSEREFGPQAESGALRKHGAVDLAVRNLSVEQTQELDTSCGTQTFLRTRLAPSVLATMCPMFDKKKTNTR